MIDPLYQKEILRLAASAHGAGKLEAPTVSANIRNPLCGDQITVDMTIADGRISEIAHQTRACVLCQASASLMAQTLPGLTAQNCESGLERIRAFLGGDAEAAWPQHFTSYAVFGPVVEHPSRHTCVLLPFEAVMRAFTDLKQSAV